MKTGRVSHLWAVPGNFYIWTALATLCYMGLIGFCDSKNSASTFCPLEYRMVSRNRLRAVPVDSRHSAPPSVRGLMPDAPTENNWVPPAAGLGALRPDSSASVLIQRSQFNTLN